VIHISGPHALDAWKRVVRRVGKGKGDRKKYGNECVRAGEMVRCMVVHPQTGKVLDDGMAVFSHSAFYRRHIT
jgi:tRNA modification GTPase